MQTTLKTVGKDLSAFREATGKTLDEIARDSGLSVPTLIAIENEKVKKPHSNTIFKLNNYFRTIPDLEPITE